MRLMRKRNQSVLKSLILGLVVLLLLGLTLQGGDNQAPQARFSLKPDTPTINDPVVFDGTASQDPDGQIVRYEWDFDGDGAIDLSSSSPKAEWLYDQPGDYQVILRVTDNGGATAMAQTTLTVQDAPVAVRQRLETPIRPNKVLPGDKIRVTVTITAHAAVNGLGLQAELPQGWKIRAVDNGNAAFKKQDAQWLWVQGLLSGDRTTVIYEVIVPGNARPGIYRIAGFVQSFSPRFKIPIPKDLEVQVL